MNHYRIYGMHFLSDFKFVQLLPLSEEEMMEPVRFQILEGVIPKEYKRDSTCYSEIDTKVSYLSNSSCYLLVENGSCITLERKPGASEANLNAYLLGWGLAMLCFQQGKPAIHCSCVADDRGALLVSGRSGSGKSTVTTQLLKEGYTLVADDMVIVDVEEQGRAYALPAYPYQKLCRDAAEQCGMPMEEMLYIDEKKDKFLVPYRGAFSKKPLPIRGMILLDWCEEEKIAVTEIAGADKLYACVDALFLRALFKKSLYRRENVETGLKLASCIPIYLVSRSKEYHSASEVVDTIKRIE